MKYNCIFLYAVGGVGRPVYISEEDYVTDTTANGGTDATENTGDDDDGVDDSNGDGIGIDTGGKIHFAYYFCYMNLCDILQVSIYVISSILWCGINILL